MPKNLVGILQISPGVQTKSPQKVDFFLKLKNTTCYYSIFYIALH